MLNLCKFSNALGKVGEGFHKWRLGKDAGGDLLLTLAVAIALGYIPKGPSATIWIIILLLLAIFIHHIFCVKTSVHNWLGASKANVLPFALFLITMGILLAIWFK